jgi:hypothetical protein
MRWRIRATAILMLVTGVVLADPTAVSVPLSPYGDAVDSSSGAPVALSPTAVLVSTKGQDGEPATADDLTLLVLDLDGATGITPLPTPFVSADSARITRLSMTRAAMSTAGEDGVLGTADDAVLVLDRLGSGNLTIPIVVGGLGDNQQFTPVRLATDRIAVATYGPDLEGNTADDGLLIIDDVAGTPVIRAVAAPFQRSSGRSMPIALTTSVVVIAGNGPDGKHSTADDVVHVVEGIGGTIVTSEIPAPGLNRRAAGRPVRVSRNHALVLSAGPDGKDSTEDDVALLLDVPAKTATAIPLPWAKDGSGGRPVFITSSIAVTTTNGEDGIEGTADDAVAVLSGLGTTNDVESVVVGATGDDNNCRPSRLGPTSCALVTFGSDLEPGTGDDQVVILRDLDTVPTAEFVSVGALASGTTSTIVPVSSTALVVAGGGADLTMGTTDDALVLLSGIGAVIDTQSIPAEGAFDASNHFQYVPKSLGEGTVAFLSSGPDGVLGTGGDDAVRVVSGLLPTTGFEVRRLKVRLPREDGRGRARAILRGRLTEADPASLEGADLSFALGNASQTLPAGSLERRRGVLRYRDRKNEHGIIRKLKIRVRDGRIIVKMRGAEEELASTEPAYVPVGVEIGEDLVPRSLTTRKKGRRLLLVK